MSGCELCGKAARMYCESDQANLCRDCDERVHCANFLVEKHTRVLLCHVCHLHTPWRASGPKLGPSISICHHCFSLHSHKHHEEPQRDSIQPPHQGINVQEEQEYDHNSHNDVDDGDGSDDGDDDDDEDDDDEEEEEEEEGENQVVPWSCPSSLVHDEPPVDSSSSSEENSSQFSGSGHNHVLGLKRMRDNSHGVAAAADLDSDVCV